MFGKRTRVAYSNESLEVYGWDSSELHDIVWARTSTCVWRSFGSEKSSMDQTVTLGRRTKVSFFCLLETWSQNQPICHLNPFAASILRLPKRTVRRCACCKKKGRVGMGRWVSFNSRPRETIERKSEHVPRFTDLIADDSELDKRYFFTTWLKLLYIQTAKT